MSDPNKSSTFTITKAALVEETLSILRKWDSSLNQKQNLDGILQERSISASSQRMLKDIIKVLKARYDFDIRDKPLVTLASSDCTLEEWRPIQLWHMTRGEFLLKDFLQNWLFNKYIEGYLIVRSEDMADYLKDIPKQGHSSKESWSKNTIDKMSTCLLKIATQLGFLKGNVSKEFRSYHLPERSFLYILHAIYFEEHSITNSIESSEWSMFMMQPQDVENELFRMDQQQSLRYQVAGSVREISLPYSNLIDLVGGLFNG